MRRPALWALLVVLPVTLGLRSVEQHKPEIDTERMTADAASSLTRNGWVVRPRKHPLIGWLVEGARGTCRILVHVMPPEGNSDDKFRSIAEPVGPVTYQVGGQIHHDFPRLVPMLHGHAQRYAWSFGVAIPTAPPVATARSRSCGTLVPDFTALRQHLKSRST